MNIHEIIDKLEKKERVNGQEFRQVYKNYTGKVFNGFGCAGCMKKAYTELKRIVLEADNQKKSVKHVVNQKEKDNALESKEMVNMDKPKPKPRRTRKKKSE